MKIDEQSKEVIINSCQFLINFGYILTELKNDSITFSNKKIDFIIGYERYDEISTLYIRFWQENELFNIGWIAFVRGEKSEEGQSKLDNITHLLDYIEKNYAEITNFQFCQESRKMIEDFMNKE
ncbi:hypothetical protein IA929_04080 [Listeria seeligeri]|uniref:hypothetical protein n=2 Tax=Listeria seeligeri TaxID=1640 RepID=UPI001886E235|nr:hypothetical protein [Listeria seeligeri]MBF2599179.1 hypothetical protein [Listeria seeligeri]